MIIDVIGSFGLQIGSMNTKLEKHSFSSNKNDVKKFKNMPYSNQT